MTSRNSRIPVAVTRIGPQGRLVRRTLSPSLLPPVVVMNNEEVVENAGGVANAAAPLQPRVNPFPAVFSNVAGGPSVHEFLYRLNAAYDMCDWVDARRLQHVPILLGGTPARFHQDFQRRCTADGRWAAMTWADYSTALTTACDPHGTAQFLNDAIRDRRQGDAEAADTHIYAVLEMCNRKNAQMTELERVSAAMGGLRDSLRKDLYVKEITTVDVLLRSAQLLEGAERLVSNSSTPAVPSSNSSSSSASGSKTSDSVTAALIAAQSADITQLTRGLTELTSSVAALTTSIPTLVAQQVRSQLPSSSVPPVVASCAALPSASAPTAAAPAAAPTSCELFLQQMQQQIAQLQAQQVQQNGQQQQQQQYQQGQQQQFGGGPRHFGSRTSDGMSVCGRCNRRGHQARTCRLPSDIRCHQCNRNGHVKNACRNGPQAPQQQQQQPMNGGYAQQQPQQQQAMNNGYVPQQQQQVYVPQQQQQMYVPQQQQPMQNGFVQQQPQQAAFVQQPAVNPFLPAQAPAAAQAPPAGYQGNPQQPRQ
jgi:hypothetical protein